MSIGRNSDSPIRIAVAFIDRAVRLAQYEPRPSTPEKLGAYVKSEIAKWAGVIRDANIPREGQY
jgi:hypothetical protein